MIPNNLSSPLKLQNHIFTPSLHINRLKLPIRPISVSIYLLQIAMVYPSLASSIPQNHSGIEIASESQAPPLYHHQANDFEASTSISNDADPNKNRSNSYLFDIFINHRGPEVKKTFASHLYRRLISYGLRPFLDYQEMQEGENITSQIRGAIAHASVHVAIFSPRYAESQWCLNELLLMRDSRVSIIPVFYNVKPADLRWTEGKDGVYASALQSLQKKTAYDPETHKEKPRYDSNTIKSWREALASVSEISGFELDACNGDEGELLDKVVERLLKKVQKPSFNVAKYPTGLEEKVQDFEDFLLQQPKGKPKVVGIVGLGGIGKTTLAKELFNRKCSYYPTSCFLSDIREKAAKNSLNDLQRKFLQSMGRFDKLKNGFHEDIEILIKDRSSFDKSLLILDDAENADQLYAFLPHRFKDVLPSDCLVLITSRDKSVLLRLGLQESSIYKLTGLNIQHSIELFCLHAFCQPHSPHGFHSLVERISKACKGLPLSLRVVGALLSGNDDKNYWEGQLDTLKSILPTEIQQKLKISYDSLNKEEQRIFLDIACYFIGVKRDTAVRIWERSGWKGSWGLQNLQNKCLVELDSENCIDMHDQLRDLGREIAEGLGLFMPCLWRHRENMEIDDLVQKSSEITRVRGISMIPSACIGNDESKYYASLRSDMPWFRRRIHKLFRNNVWKLSSRFHYTFHPGITMSNLQLLVTEDHLLERVLRTARLPDLRCLRWYKCVHSSLPSWIPMKTLRVLYVGGSGLKTLWQGKSQAPLQLRELEIWAPLSKFPKSIGMLKQLEQIYISLPKENNLISLSKEFCELSSLKRLDLINAWKMKALPDLFGNLTNLEHLNMPFSFSLARIPNSFENLTSLKFLDLRGSHFLTFSTQTLGEDNTFDFVSISREIRGASERERLIQRYRKVTMNLPLLPLQFPRSLQELHITELPSNIADLSNLEVLELEDSFLEMLPSSLSGLRNLKQLRLVECQELKRLPDSLGQLTELEVKFSHGLVEVGTLPTTLTQLSLIACSNLKKIDGLCGLAKLRILNISWWINVQELADIGTLVSLEELRASGCDKLKRIRGLGQLTRLRLLDVNGCREIEELEGVEHLRSLEKLDASGCTNLQWDGRVLENLPQRLKEGMLYI